MLARSAARRPGDPMDPLLDLLRALDLRGGVFLDAEMTAPWGVTSRVHAEDYGASFRPAHVIAYHYVTEGHCVLEVDGHPPVNVRAGDIIIVPRNDPHRLASASNVKTVNAG